MQFLVATLIAFAALIVAYFTFMQQRMGGGFKRIHYTVFWDLLSLNRGEDRIDELIDGPISVNLEPGGRRLVLPIAFKLKLANTGTAPILPADFASPLTINFGKQCNFMGGTIDCSPHSVADIFKSNGFEVDQGCLKIKPFLLNIGDEITFTGVLNGIIDEDGITVTGRVAGVNTFTRLQSKEGGIQQKLEVKSMLYELMSDWPENPSIDAKVLVMPKFLPLDEVAPGDANQNGITTRINGVRVENMHVVSFLFRNTSSKTLYLRRAPIEFESHSSKFYHAEALLNGENLPNSEISKLLKWNSHNVAIRIGKLASDDSLLVKFVSEGDVDDLRIVNRPEAIEDVQTMRARVVEDPLGKNMLGIKPHILLMSRRIHRKVHSDMPKIIVYWSDLKNRVRKVIHDDK